MEMKPKQRDYQMDTIKGILIICVVFGHMMPGHEYLGTTLPVYKHLYYAIYLFHMPAFVFIAGYFSKHTGTYGVYAKKTIAACLVPYLFLIRFML